MIENDAQAAFRRGRDLSSMDAVSRLQWANLADQPQRQKRPTVATVQAENSAQAYLRAGRSLLEMEPDRRLAWANAATPGVSAPTDPKVQEGPTLAQRQYLGSHRSVADLEATDREMYDYLGSEIFHDKAEASA